MNSSSSPSIASTLIDIENRALTSSTMDTHHYSECGIPAEEPLTGGVQTMSEGDRDARETSTGAVDHS